MGLDDDLPLDKLKNDVLSRLGSSIDKFGWDKLQQHIPASWFHDDKNRLNLDSLRKLKVPVKEFASLLCNLQLKEPMSLLMAFIPVYMLEEMEETVRVESGETFRLECKARGFPLPKFKWFRRRIGETRMSEIRGQTTSILCIDNFRTSDVGVYACRASNVNKQREKFSVESIRVTVMELTDCSDHVSTEKSVSKKPVITQGPVGHPEVHIGASIILEVIAEGEEPLVFEWFRNGQPVENAVGNKLEFRLMMPELEDKSPWTYYCLVSNKHGKTMSQPATVRLAKKSITTVYHAEDKVALLIGNGNYTHLHPLLSPVEDVATLANQLKREQFKVIALSDLDLIEMKNAVKYFCSLLDKGIYGFFYYAGHGFEYNNQRYMQPINSWNNFSIEGSLCAEFVHAEMEKRKPRLAALLFDMCRTERERTEINNGEQTIVYKPDPHPNFIIAFATIFQKRAYEMQGLRNGVFVSYLKKYINEKISIQTIIDNVIADVNADPVAGKFQHPSTHKALPEDYSLTDRIVVTDESAAEIRNARFQHITVCPRGFYAPVLEFAPDVTLTMSATPHRRCILNGLDIILKLYSPYTDVQFFPFFEVENENVKEIPIKNVPVKENETAFGVSVFYLQKLEEKVLAKISIRDEKKTVYHEIKLDLGMPLVMAANLSRSNERSKPVEEDSWTET